MKLTKGYKAIRLKCLDCTDGWRTYIRVCPCTGCMLWPFRFGAGPESLIKKGNKYLNLNNFKGQEDTEVVELNNWIKEHGALPDKDSLQLLIKAQLPEVKKYEISTKGKKKG